jgi:hypothetical protein
VSALPKGFSLRLQGGSTFLEIDLSHFDGQGVHDIANAIAQTKG